jgi:hypothetical protein
MASQNRDRIKLGVWNGPGSAERREERRTASGARLGLISVFTRVFNARWFEIGHSSKMAGQTPGHFGFGGS